MNWMPATPPQAARTLVVALVNNMPDTAKDSAEQQFAALLHAALPGQAIELRRFTCGDITGIAQLPVDAVIVTGAEPRAGSLQDEPIWNGVTWLADWAERHGTPVIWSCLAAHAAVLHLDGIARVRLPRKLSGVFASATRPSALTACMPLHWSMPHSRHHDLPEASLDAGGYDTLATSDEAGAGIFVKRSGAPFLFLQGHPEYAAGTLTREYHRDVRRFFEGAYDNYPDVPRNCFDAATAAALADIERSALRAGRDPALLLELRRVLRAADNGAPWLAPAGRVLANWLADAVDETRLCPAGPEFAARINAFETLGEAAGG